MGPGIPGAISSGWTLAAQELYPLIGPWHPTGYILWVDPGIPGAISSNWTLASQELYPLRGPWYTRSYILWLDPGIPGAISSGWTLVYQELYPLIGPWHHRSYILWVDPGIPGAVSSDWTLASQEDPDFIWAVSWMDNHNLVITYTRVGCWHFIHMTILFMPPPLGAGGIMFSGCLSVCPSVQSLKYPLLTCTWVRWSTRPTVTVLRHVRPSVWRGFRAFAGERIEGMAWNFTCWCILTISRTD